MSSAVVIANLALDEIPHRNIVSLNDNVLAADVVKRQLPQVLGEIMEMGDWSFGVERKPLAEIVNTRPEAWKRAYAVPPDVAVPLRLFVANGAPGSYTPGPGQVLAQPFDGASPTPPSFDFEGQTLWTNLADASLEYITESPAFYRMSRRFMRVLALTLAARCVVPITKDKDRKRELLQEAELFGQRALAGDRNANSTQQTYGDDFIPTALQGYFTAPE